MGGTRRAVDVGSDAVRRWARVSHPSRPREQPAPPPAPAEPPAARPQQRKCECDVRRVPRAAVETPRSRTGDEAGARAGDKAGHAYVLLSNPHPSPNQSQRIFAGTQEWSRRALRATPSPPRPPRPPVQRARRPARPRQQHTQRPPPRPPSPRRRPAGSARPGPSLPPSAPTARPVRASLLPRRQPSRRPLPTRLLRPPITAVCAPLLSNQMALARPFLPFRSSYVPLSLKVRASQTSAISLSTPLASPLISSPILVRLALPPPPPPPSPPPP